MNLATGDKFCERKWMDYYNLESEFGPKFGHF